MMQRRRQETRAARETEPLPAAPAAASATTRVRVIAGADVEDMELAGRRVADARVTAQAILGIDRQAIALLDGRRVGEDHVLAGGQLLEFVKHAGQKGAGGAEATQGRSAGSVIEVAADRATWLRNGRPVGAIPVRDLLGRVTAAGDEPQRWRLHPRQVRLMAERRGGEVNGVVIEMPPGPRRVSWITDAPDARHAPRRSYDVRLSFPWVVLVVVFAHGELSGIQQAFYRNAPLGSLDDPLCYTNLLNVARGHQQESWVCLVNLERSLGRLTWGDRVQAVTEHFWHASFNRSAEAHEGNSYWSAGCVDPRLASAAAWEEATRENPYFALEVGWRRAPHTLGQTLHRMLDMVAPWQPVERVEHLVTLMQQGTA